MWKVSQERVSQELRDAGLRSSRSIGLGIGTRQCFYGFCWLGEIGQFTGLLFDLISPVAQVSASLFCKDAVLIYLMLHVLIIVKATSQRVLTTFVAWDMVDLPSLPVSAAVGHVPQRYALIQSRAIQFRVEVSGWLFHLEIRGGFANGPFPAGEASERSWQELRLLHNLRASMCSGLCGEGPGVKAVTGFCCLIVV